MKKVLSVLTALAISTSASAALVAGDLAFTSYNTQEDGFSLASFANIAANTTIYFSDNEYVSGQSKFNDGESYFSWNTGASTIAAGTVVRFSGIDAPTRAASVGTFSQVTVSGSTNTGLSATADILYAYSGTSATAPTTFLSIISSESVTNTNASIVGTGLTVGNGVTQLANGAKFADYTGVRTGATTFATYKPLVYNAANWLTVTAATPSQAGAVPNLNAFTIAPVPEPSEYALLLSGLGLIGFVVRRRANQRRLGN